ncbi:MAG: MerR family transcriptional regulator [Candidatus Sulfotelmatobacter sp.]|jgi:DNA-binding transcriptional MerR regulator
MCNGIVNLSSPVGAQTSISESFHIGTLAARTGRSIHAIRWYEAQGLIPGVVRDNGRRRVYNELHLGWLDLIDRLRRTGMSIAQMREYAALVKQGHRTLRKRHKLLSAHRARVKEKITEWTQALKLVDRKIDFYGEWLTTGRRPAMLPPQNLRKRPQLRRRRRKLR